MKSIILVLFFFIVRISFAEAMEHPSHEQLEIKSLRQILPYIEPNTIVFLDLDRTLFTQLTDGNDLKLCELEPPKTRSAARIVRKMQKLGAKVFGLTARRSTEEVFNYTKNDLAIIGVGFNKLPNNLLPIYDYNDGVFFTSGGLKGEFLASLMKNKPILKSLGPFQKIIFVDDQKGHLNSVRECIASSKTLNNIPSVVTHFTAATDLEINIIYSAHKTWNKYNKEDPEVHLDLETVQYVCAKLYLFSNTYFPTEAYILDTIQAYSDNYKDLKLCVLSLKAFNIDHRVYNENIFLGYYEKVGINITVSSIDELLSHLPRSLKEFIYDVERSVDTVLG